MRSRKRNELRIVVSFIIVAVMLIWAPTAAAFTDPLRVTVEREIANLFQGPVKIGDVSMTNLSRIAVVDVVVYDPLNPKERMLEVEEVSIKYSLFGVLFNRDELGKALREITLKEPKLRIAREGTGWNVQRLAKSATGNGEVHLDIGVEKGQIIIENLDDYMPRVVANIEGTMTVRGADLAITHLGVDALGVKMAAKGDIKDGQLDLVASAMDFELQKLMANLPQVQDLFLSATGSVTVYAKGEVTDPRITGIVEARQGRIGLPQISKGTHEIDRAYASFSYSSGVINVDKISLEARQGVLSGVGKAMARGDIDFAVTGENIDLAKYLPMADQARINGPVQFTGRIFGNFQNPVARGDIYKKGGTFFDVPVDDVRGTISIDMKGFAFEGIKVRKANALVELNGLMNYGPGSQMDVSVVATEMEAADLLRALRLEPVARGSLTGRLHFHGPLGRLETTGDIRLANGHYGTQRFDVATARFSVTPTKTQISDATVWIGGGKVRLSGGTTKPGELQLAMTADAVPLEKVRFFDGVDTGFAGLVSFRGNATVTGTLSKPLAKLQLDLNQGERLAVGPRVRLDFNYSSSQLQGR